MPIRKGIPLVALVSACLSAQPSGSPKELTARELFYVAVEQPKAAAKPAAVKPPEPKVAAKAPARTPVQSATRTKPAAAPPAPVRSSPPPRPASPDGTPIVTAAAQVRRTAPAPTAGPPLGLRYTITRLVDGRMVEAAPDTVFRGGDRIKLTVSTNSPGYLYIVNLGSSGAWKPIFPSPEVEDGNNRVESMREYELPPKSRMIFDSQPGAERLFVVLSREPEPDFERLIYSLRTPRSKPASAAEPEPPARTPPRTMVAANIGNDLVGRMRNVYARDLVIEKVDEDTPGDRKEKAVYVVNASGSSDSRVVADISLVHQ